jgi:hypothetical protein
MNKGWSGQGQNRVGRSDERKPDRGGFGIVIPNPKLKLLEQVREVMRLKHYSIRTERCYSDWIRRFIRFHRMRSREELAGGRGKVELFLSDLAVNGHVAAATQNQAFNALLFLYREVLNEPLEGVDSVRARRPLRVPVVLTMDEARRVTGAGNMFFRRAICPWIRAQDGDSDIIWTKSQFIGQSNRRWRGSGFRSG